MDTLAKLYFFIGKMGAGKTSYSSSLAADLNAVLISEDEWLSKLYPKEIKNFDDYLERHRHLLTVIGPHVQQILTSGATVVLDFPANTVKSRAWFMALAKSASVQHKAIYLKCSNDQCLQQLKKRSVEQPQRSNFDTPEVFEQVTLYFEEPSESEALNLQLV